MGTSIRPDSVSHILFGETRREVLTLLLGRPDESFYLREIIRLVGGGSGAVQRELKQLVDAGLVHRVARGPLVYFSANREAAIFPELQSIVEKTAGAVDLLRAGLAPLVGRGLVELALIHGSVASGRQTSHSDVDALVVGDITLTDLLPGLREAEKRLGREVNPSVYPVSDFRQKLRRGNPFLNRVVAGPKLFVVGDESDLGRLAGEPLDRSAPGKRARNR
jgi:DNA-binding transcriptional ArsR family regulator